MERPGPQSAPGSEAYLQCAEQLLCFKVAVYEGDRAAVRNHFSRELLNAARQLGFPAKRPGRLGSWTWMTVAVMEGDYRSLQGNNFLNWHHLSQTLAMAGSVLELAVGFLNAHNAIEIISGRLLDIDFDLVATRR